MSYKDLWEGSMRTLRFVKGEVAIVNIDSPLYYGTPCTVEDVGPWRCTGCGNLHDYVVRLCDGDVVSCDDPDLKKFQPPADEQEESETVTNEDEVTA